MNNKAYILYVVLYTLAIVGFFSLAALVSLRQKTLLYRAFSFFAGGIGIWQSLQFLSQLISAHHLSSILLFQSSIAVSGFLGVGFYQFARAYTGKRPYSTSATVLVPVVSALLAYTSPALRDAKITFEGIAVSSIDWHYGVVVAVIAIYFILGLKEVLVHLIRSSDKKQRSRDIVLLAGIFEAFIVVAASSILFPNSLSSQVVVPLSTFIAVTIIAYSIVYYRLFDIRAVVAVALGYISSLAILSGIYGGIVFILTVTIFKVKLPVSADISLVILTGIAAASFQNIKQFFDRITNKIFYRDSYDSQELISDLNKALVSTLDIEALLRHADKVISSNLKSSFCSFVINKTAYSPQRVISSSSIRFDMKQADLLHRLAVKLRRIVIVGDYLNSSQADLKQVLSSNSVDVLVRLSPRVDTAEEGLGYMLLGSKRSGNAYSEADLRILTTIAGELIIAIQNSLRFEEIQNFNATLQAQINEATRKLRRTNDKLKALDEAKDDFVSMASHQLRTPLTSIKGYTSMVLEGDAGKINATQRRLLEQSFTSSQRMVYLIADLLNVSRLKTGKFIIEQAPVNLAELVQQEIGQLIESAAGRQLTLNYDQPETFPTLLLDETKTRQVVMNFVDNAIYYTPAGGHIKVELVETPSSVEFKVTDDGIGVPKSEQPHLFTKFYRAGNARKARPDGTGLGLFMAKKVIVAEGGAIVFETEEGKGSTFGFVFSKSKMAPGTVEVPNSDATPVKS